jgi:hypothetical protein
MSARGDACNVHFEKDVCVACPFVGRCPVKVGKRSASMRYTLHSLQCALNRVQNLTPENRHVAGMRNGMEGTISELKRVEKAGHVRVRGDGQVNATNYLKALGLNIRRLHLYLLKLSEVLPEGVSLRRGRINPDPVTAPAGT